MSTMMSRWTHALCDRCWDLKNPHREPHRFMLEKRLVQKCCSCSVITMSGIYYRDAPDTVHCGGIHEESS